MSWGTETAEVAQRGTRPLDMIEQVAHRLENVGFKIEGFLDRMQSGPEQPKDPRISPVPSGYLGQLENLSNIVNRMDELANRLGDLG